MNIFTRERILLVLLLLFGSFGLAAAQDNPPPPQQFDGPPPNEKRPNLLRELGLTPDQMQQIKQMNMERKPEIEAATRRLREANRNLDMAIYADTVDENEVQARLREFQAAQAELAKLRFTSELTVRKILTPEQLVKFRELRRQFAEMRRQRENQPSVNPNFRQMRRALRNQNPNRPNP